MKKYQIIYADPPWCYNFPHTRVKKVRDYKSLSIDEICSFPIKEISSDNSLLFIWVTFRNLFISERVIKAWGFEYKTCAFVWVKKTNRGKDFFGMGEYTRANPELCLVARKGKNIIESHRVRQLQYSKVFRHSEKPSIFKEKILELCGDKPRIELFARQKTEGWDVWGNEVESDIKLEVGHE